MVSDLPAPAVRLLGDTAASGRDAGRQEVRDGLSSVPLVPEAADSGSAAPGAASLALGPRPDAPYSRRFCTRDGASMLLQDRDTPRRRWSCPACGRQEH